MRIGNRSHRGRRAGRAAARSAWRSGAARAGAPWRPRCGRVDIQHRHVPQLVTQVAQVAHFPAPGQPGRAGPFGGGQVAGLGQDHGHDLAEGPVQRAYPPGYPPRLVRELDGAVPVAAVPCGPAEAGQGQRLRRPGS